MQTGPAFADALAHLPDYLGQHVLVSFTAMALGLVVSLPLAVFALSRPKLQWTLLAAASVVQTIPGLALLALFYPVLLGIAGLTARWLGSTSRRSASSRRARAGALFGPADPAQYRDRHRRDRSGADAGCDRPRHDRPERLWMVELPLALRSSCRHPDVGRVGDRHGDTLHTRRPDQPPATTSSPGSRRRTGSSSWSAPSRRPSWRC